MTEVKEQDVAATFLERYMQMADEKINGANRLSKITFNQISFIIAVA